MASELMASESFSPGSALVGTGTLDDATKRGRRSFTYSDRGP